VELDEALASPRQDRDSVGTRPELREGSEDLVVACRGEQRWHGLIDRPHWTAA
jgi:hypothetical protein